jgi:Cd2+/Zn2+-exporting ATPase
MTEKYIVRNIDCANCAAKIEKSLRKLDEVEFASLDFASQTLHVKTSDNARVFQEVRRIEPGVELVPQQQEAPFEAATPEYHVKREVAVLVAASILFFAEIFLGRWTPLEPPLYLELLIVFSAYLLAGWNVILGALRTVRRGIFFDENVLMVIATAGAIAINEFAEAVAVMIFYKVGELLQEMAVSRSRRSIRGLLAARPDKAFLKTPEGLREVSPESVNVGAVIVIKPGNKVPLDGEIVEGASQVDASVLTGESVPAMARPGDFVMAGAINKTGALSVEVTKAFKDSSIARMMELVENASARKARTENFITTFARYYTPAVVLIAACVAFIPPVVLDASYKAWIYRALVLLVISCPCALVVSIPLGFFGGIGRASRRGILVKGSNFLDALAAVKTVVFDKTGTLTKGVFQVRGVVSKNGFSKDEILEFAAAAEHHSHHPIATSILAAMSEEGRVVDESAISDHTDFSGQGVTARYNGRTILVGNDSFLHHHDIEHPEYESGVTVAHVAVDGTYAGYIEIGDEIKPDARQTIRRLKGLGVDHVAMLTGDNARAAQAVAEELELDGYYADLLPENKVQVMENLIEARGNEGKAAFVGDGVNDAPVIARADVGVAMGALGSDAAIETADVVLMTDSPSKMAESIEISKLTRRIVWQNIALAFSVKGFFLVFGVMGVATMWEAVFADMGTAVLAVVNSTRIIGRKNEPGGDFRTNREVVQSQERSFE